MRRAGLSVLKAINNLYTPRIRFSDSDTFLVSYPKSGNTWLRFLIGNYLTDNECDFINHHLIIPDVHDSPEFIKNANKPRLIKSHLPFRSEYKNVVYLVRDGRDVAVSYYYHLIKYHKLDKSTSFSSYLKCFTSGNLDTFGSWNDHINSWLFSEQEKSTRLLMIKYEDLLHDTSNTFSKVLEFIGIGIDLKKMESAIEASTFKNMKRLEEEQEDLGKHLKGSDKSISFVRSGQTGNWKELFSKEDLDRFLTVHESNLKRLHYI